MATQSTHTDSDTNQQPAMGLQRIYIKDFSFEAPGAPDIFKETNWKPSIHLDLNTHSAVLEKDVHEVVLSLTVTAKAEEKVGFLLEIKQAGIFTLTGFEQAMLDHALGAYCPSMLYPYAREAITDMVNRGSFPQLLLAPINFDALYVQQLEQRKSGGSEGGGSTTVSGHKAAGETVN